MILTRYNREIKDKAKAMYINEESFAAIAREIGCADTTVRKWCIDEGWAEDRDRVWAQSSIMVMEKVNDLVSDRMLQHIKIYQDVQQKGIEALADTPVRTVAEAMKLIDTGIKGERSITSYLMPMVFVRRIADIITSNVQDEETLRRIANEIALLGQEYLENRN